MKVTAGMKSSELWLVVIVTALATFWPDMPTESFFVAGTYVISRGLAKWGKAKEA